MKTTPLGVRLFVLAPVYIAAATQMGAAVDTIARLKDNDAHRQAYDDTVLAYENDRVAFEQEVARRLEYSRNVAKTKEATEALLSQYNGVEIKVVTPRLKPVAGSEFVLVEPTAPVPYVAPPAPEARAYFLQWGHEWGKTLHQWSKDIS